MTDNSTSYTFKTFIRNKKFLNLSTTTIIIGSFLIVFIGLIGIFVSYFWGIILFIAFVVPVVTKLIHEKKYNDTLSYKNHNSWGKGAKAELVVQKSLEALPLEYKIISDLQTGRGNIDFIIIGPKGIFTIECKATHGFISLLNGQLYSGMRLLQGNYIKQTQAEKLWVKHTLEQHFGRAFPVTGLLEFVNGKIDTQTINGEIQHIWIGGYKFHEYLINKSRNSLTTEEIEQIYNFFSAKN